MSLGAFDIAGNFSGWSEPLKITLPNTVSEPVSGSVSQVRPTSPKLVHAPSSRSFPPLAERTAADITSPESSNEAKPLRDTIFGCSATSASDRSGLAYHLLGFGAFVALRRLRRKKQNRIGQKSVKSVRTKLRVFSPELGLQRVLARATALPRTEARWAALLEPSQ